MGKNKITRRLFINKTTKGIGGCLFLPCIDNRRRLLGNTGIYVSPICFGATGTLEPSVFKYAFEKGINFIDTGRSYNNGNNELIVGQAISKSRKDFIVLSKLRLEKNELTLKGKGKEGSAEIKKILGEKTRLCLNALKTDYIDVLLYHDAIDEDLLFHDATMNFFSSLKQSGIIRAHGFSFHNSNLHFAERNNSEAFYNVLMVPFNRKGCYYDQWGKGYSSWDRSKQLSILTSAVAKGIGIIAIKPFSGFKEESQASEIEWITGQEIISSTVLPIDSFETCDKYMNMLSL